MTADLRLSPHQRLTVVESSSERLVVESLWDATAGAPLLHWHPSQREDFEILQGRLRVTRAGHTEVFGVGQAFSVAPGEVHGMAPDGVTTRARWEVTSALGTEQMFRDLAAAGSRAAELRVIARHRDEFRLASPPDAVQRVLLGVIRLLPERPRNS